MMKPRLKVILDTAEPNTCHINPFNTNETETEINDFCENSSAVTCNFNCNPYINKPICCMKPNELNVSNERYKYITDLNNIEISEGDFKNNARFISLKQELSNSLSNRDRVNIYNNENLESINSLIDRDELCKRNDITDYDICNSSNTTSDCCRIPA